MIKCYLFAYIIIFITVLQIHSADPFYNQMKNAVERNNTEQIKNIINSDIDINRIGNSQINLLQHFLRTVCGILHEKVDGIAWIDVKGVMIRDYLQDRLPMLDEILKTGISLNVQDPQNRNLTPLQMTEQLNLFHERIAQEPSRRLYVKNQHAMLAFASAQLECNQQSVVYALPRELHAEIGKLVLQK